MDISKYRDITLEKSNYDNVKDIDCNDIEIKYDWFDCYSQESEVTEIFSIIKNESPVGYIAMYNKDDINRNISIYGKVAAKQFLGDFLKAILSVMDYIFTRLYFNRVNFIYREDNYCFDDVCRFLYFVKEGVLRNCICGDDRFVNLNIYGILAYEYRQYLNNEYKRMFTWDYEYEPKDYIHINIDDELNCRSFTNSLDNPNSALMNDSLYEFALNKSINPNNYLEYKKVRFPVKIFDISSKYDSLICKGQVIDVPIDRYKEILFIATAQFGYKETYFTVEYSDDEVEIVPLALSDWCECVLRDEYIIHHAYGCRRLDEKENMIKCDSYLFLKRIEFRTNKAIKKIEFPKNQDILIYSIILSK